MKVTLFSEELHQAQPSIKQKVIDGVSYVGVEIGTSEFNCVTFWFESKAEMDEYFTSILQQIIGS